jgi:hypothetical protein
MVSSSLLARARMSRLGFEFLAAIFDFSDGLVHGWRGTSACGKCRPNNMETPDEHF